VGEGMSVGGVAVGGTLVSDGLAVGGTALGGSAVGGTAVDGVAVGGMRVGGEVGVGGVGVGGIVVAVGGIAVGGTAVGGSAVGTVAAVGRLLVGLVAVGVRHAGSSGFADAVAVTVGMVRLRPRTSPTNAVMLIMRRMRFSFGCPDAKGRLLVLLILRVQGEQISAQAARQTCSSRIWRPARRPAVGAGCPDRAARRAICACWGITRVVLVGAYAAGRYGASFSARERWQPRKRRRCTALRQHVRRFRRQQIAANATDSTSARSGRFGADE
jgi:hypothetical protein